MKIKPILFPILLLLGVLGFSKAMAQEDRIPDLDSGIKDIRYETSTDLNPEGDFKNSKPILTSRDSVSLKTVPRRPEQKGKNGDENSVLSFNFLYYLIERYKLSDIVD